MMNRISRYFILAAAMVIAVASVSFAQTTKPGGFPTVQVKNFGQMDTNYYRGGQPKRGQYKALADLGIKTVVDLRNDPTSYEKREVEALGMKYVNIPMDDAEYPSQEAIDKFLAIVNDPESGAVFAHCKGGKHRAGVTGAVYRFTKYGWNYDQVYEEMLNYGFHTRWGRGVMKDFVKDYAAKMNTQPRKETTVTAAAAGKN